MSLSKYSKLLKEAKTELERQKIKDEYRQWLSDSEKSIKATIQAEYLAGKHRSPWLEK